MIQKLTLIIITLYLITFGGYGQETKKIPLDFTVYDDWNTLEKEKISADGKWISYVTKPQKGDGWIYLYDDDNNTLDSVERGDDPVFAFTSDFLAFRVKPPLAISRQEKKEKVKDEEKTGDSLAIRVFDADTTYLFPEVKSFTVPGKGSNWIGFVQKLKPVELELDTAVIDTTGSDGIDNKESKEKLNCRFVLFNPVQQKSLEIPGADEFVISENGKLAAATRHYGDSIDSVSLYIIGIETLHADSFVFGPGKITKMKADKRGEQVAFLFTSDTAENKIYSCLHYHVEMDEPEIIVDTNTVGIPEKWAPSEHGSLWFAEDGSRLFMGTAPKPVPEPQDTLLDEEKVRVDVWNWQDTLLQPMQKIQLDKEKKRTFLAFFDLKKKSFYQLGNETIRQVRVYNKGMSDFAIGIDDKKYATSASWNFLYYRDYYLINMKTGESNLFMAKNTSFPSLSPGNNYIYWYEYSDSSWYAHDIKKDRLVYLTQDMGVPFYDVENDIPAPARSYGSAGWTKDDRFFLVYDQYDIWQIDPRVRKEPVNLTGGYGRENKITFRYARLDRDEEYIDPDRKFMLKAFNQDNKQYGIFSIMVNREHNPVQELYGPFALHDLQKAKNQEKYLWRKGTFNSYPNLYCSGTDFNKSRLISNVNPQKEKYYWGNVQLVSWTSFDNEKLKGLLYTPEDLDTTKKYPMVVYIYEKSSDGLYHHFIPSPSRSVINRPMYTSNGYVIFVPDINYKIGYPGESAYNAVVSGTVKMINQFPFIDQERIGLQGQSWGGYQVAYLVTRTNMYAAAMAGAPVSNMTSAYGGIRWGSGMSRMFQYEMTQSRIGGTMWDKMFLYLENSPVFYAPKIETPLLLMHNDNDGAVPWHQGIELFVALRRLHKPVWLLSYNDEEHNLTRYPNRKDLSIRMMQFFDHYLKDKPEPVWMKYGIPAINKGIEKGHELTNDNL
ncbi:MAG: alpha/beta hydrolase family protein [Bacteroidales bacterium]